MEDPNAIKTTPAVAPETLEAPTKTEIDAEARIAQLEEEKAQIARDRDNYRTGMLKAKGKIVESEFNDNDEDVTEEKMRRIANETLANSRLADIAREQDLIIKKALKENKELKLAQLNKTNIPPASVGTSNEGISVTSTSITPEQMAAFKARGWNDKDIERFKKNLQKGGGR